MAQFLNQLGNRFIAGLLRSPFHGAISRHIMLITVTGRKTGQVYTTPVEYLRQDGEILVTSHKARTWWKNACAGAPVKLYLNGSAVNGTARVGDDTHEAVVETLQKMYPRMNHAQATRMAQDRVIVHIAIAGE
jgi:deazaflavin-dependent oxidoreductase (nitroreductase family)